MQRAIVIGSPGAGKSTFARRLRDAAGEVRYGVFAGFAMGGLPLGGSFSCSDILPDSFLPKHKICNGL